MCGTYACKICRDGAGRTYHGRREEIGGQVHKRTEKIMHNKKHTEETKLKFVHGVIQKSVQT
jgi:hypothetical protein